jgi:hypothetical protein
LGEFCVFAALAASAGGSCAGGVVIAGWRPGA